MPKHVLVVDDSKEAANAKVLVIGALGKGSITAEAVYGGKVCLERIWQEPEINLILLDMDMPGVNGADVIRALLKIDPATNLKVLPMTAWGPDWIRHWNMTDLSKTHAYEKLVWPITYDKGTTPLELMTQIHQAIGMPD